VLVQVQVPLVHRDNSSGCIVGEVSRSDIRGTWDGPDNPGQGGELNNVTLYCTKLKNPTRRAVMATALDLGIN
jgi:hypothetical protein